MVFRFINESKWEERRKNKLGGCKLLGKVFRLMFSVHKCMRKLHLRHETIVNQCYNSFILPVEHIVNLFPNKCT